MAKKSSQQSEVGSRNGAVPAEVEAVSPTGEKMVDGGLSIVVPIAPEVSGKYATGRIDTELSRPDAVTMRRIQDAMESQGIKCRGTGSVVHFLLKLVRDADEAAKNRV